MIGHVEVERVLWYPCSNNTPDRVVHIPPMIFNPTTGGSLQDLKKDTLLYEPREGRMSLYVRAHRSIL